MKRIILAIAFLLCAYLVWAEVPGAPPGSKTPKLDTDCDQAKYYPLGSLCQDLDDGKLYKGTGAAVEEIAATSAFSVTDITGADDDTTPATSATVVLAQGGVLIESSLDEIGTAINPTAATLHVDDILTSLGIASEATDMGTYTGDTLTDNTTQAALNQELETAVESKLATADAATTYESISPSTQTVEEADEEVGSTPGTYTLTPTAGKKLHIVKLSTLDGDGETITMGEVGATHGNIVTVWNGSATTSLFFPWVSAGLEFVGGGAGKILTVGPYQSITLLYATDRWIVIANESSTIYLASIAVQDPSVDEDGLTMAAPGIYGGTYIASGAGTWAHSAVVASGENWSLEAASAAAVVLTINGSDTLWLNGVAQVQGVGLTSDSTVDAMVACYYKAANTINCRGVSFTATP